MLYLVQQKGIYCFYSAELVKGIAELIAGRNCLEIGAGDGTLTRFMQQAGVSVRATDNHSWASGIAYPESVEKMDAAAALRRYKPQAVICSWPPAGNDFERLVFESASVDLYIAITSRKSFASGNWNVYGARTGFSVCEDPVLSSYLLPPEADGVVLVFKRNTSNE